MSDLTDFSIGPTPLKLLSRVMCEALAFMLLEEGSPEIRIFLFRDHTCESADR